MNWKKNLPENLFIEGEKPKNFVENFIREYLNYLVYKFLGIKAYRFKDIKSGHYMIKDLEQRCLLKGKDLAENFAQWFDELYLGKYDLSSYNNFSTNINIIILFNCCYCLFHYNYFTF